MDDLIKAPVILLTKYHTVQSQIVVVIDFLELCLVIHLIQNIYSNM
jgi:hypothetical protein